MNKKLQSLQERLNILLNDQSHNNKGKQQPKQISIMLNCALEIISGVAFGLIMGYYLNKYFDAIWMFIVSVLLGFGAGVLNLYKYVKKIRDI